jgi:signal transduction histidine kinase
LQRQYRARKGENMKLVPLHEFMATHRQELLPNVLRAVRASAPDGNADDMASGFADLIDEIIRALQHDAGLSEASPLPGKSPAAMWLGSRHQARGYFIARIALDVGAISDCVGALARREGVAFAGHEYQVFNQCIDTATASALEQFWECDREQREHDETERLGLVIHELRNALAGARMAFSVLRGGEVGVRSKTGDVLDRSLRHLEALVGEMEFAVHLSAGAKLEQQQLSVATLIGNVADAAVPERNIRLERRVEQGLMVYADERLLFSAVNNLVQNAFKFTHEGGRILIRASRQGASVLIEVEDECGGLPSGKPEELFAPFVSKGKQRRGLGLGLTITRDAVEAHGGGISLTDLPGKGCVFRLTLPVQ